MLTRKIIILAALLFSGITAFAQAHSVTAEYQKSMEPGLEIEVPYPEKTVYNSIVDRFEKKGYKSKETRGYISFKSVRTEELGSGEYDLYFKVEKRNRDRDACVVTLLISSGYDKFIAEQDNPALFDKAKKMLNEQTEIAAAHDLELQIAEQDLAVKREDKKMTSLVTDSVNLQKKKTKLDADILDNSKKQELQQAEIDKQKQIYDKLVARRKQ